MNHISKSGRLDGVQDDGTSGRYEAYVIERLKYLQEKFGVDVLQIWRDFGVLNGRVRSPIAEIAGICREKTQDIHVLPAEKGAFGTPDFQEGAWRNIAKHNLFVSSATVAVARMFGITDQEEIDKLELAGMLHDAGKRMEVVYRRNAKRKGGDDMAAILEAGRDADKKLTEYGVPSEITQLFPHLGGDYLQEISSIIDRMENDAVVTDAERNKLLLLFADYCIEEEKTPAIASVEERYAGIVARAPRAEREEKALFEWDFNLMKRTRSYLCTRLRISPEQFKDMLQLRMEALLPK